jgi:hypothetical protein
MGFVTVSALTAPAPMAPVMELTHAALAASLIVTRRRWLVCEEHTRSG